MTFVGHKHFYPGAPSFIYNENCMGIKINALQARFMIMYSLLSMRFFSSDLKKKFFFNIFMSP